MSLLTAVLTVSIVTLQFASSSASDATAEYVLDSSIDRCEEAGQHKLKNQITSLLEIPPNLPKGSRWPKDSLEDEGTPMYEALSKLPEEKRWKAIGLLKAFNPVYWTETLVKELRDNTLCNFKRMECMSIDDLATPKESLNGVRAWWALYDAMDDSAKLQADYAITEMRKRVIEPVMLLFYTYVIKPPKDFVESQVPAGFPFDPIPSMPSPVEGDFNVDYKYPAVGTASLPTPEGPGYRMTKQAGWNRHRSSALLQMAEKSRQRCSDLSTETKKILCHLDFGVVMSKLTQGMKKSGELPELSTSEQDKILAGLGKIDATVQDMKQRHRTACKQATDV